jgi:hypothetical protein
MKDRTYPTEIGGLEIISVVDLTIGYDSTNPPNYTPFLPISSGHMIQFRAKSRNDGTSIVLTIRSVIYQRFGAVDANATTGRAARSQR